MPYRRAAEDGPGHRLTLLSIATNGVRQGRSPTVDGLNDLDLSYTPPFSAPWDPVQTAARTGLASCAPTPQVEWLGTKGTR
jgi:hypothetical protein